MSALQKFKAAYAPVEDRILLQATGDGWCQSFWVTRRVLSLLGQVFQKLLMHHYRKVAQEMSLNAQYAQDFSDFGREAAITQNPPVSLGAMAEISGAPILIYEIKYIDLTNGMFALLFTDTQGEGHGYQLKEDLVNALSNLLQAKANEAGWGITIIPKTVANPLPSTNKRMLN